MDQNIGLVDQGYFVSALLCELERKPHHSLDTKSGVDRELISDFVHRAHSQAPTIADVGAFGPLANHDKIYTPRITKWRFNTGHQSRGSEIHVMVKGKPQLQQQPALDNSSCKPRVLRVAAHSTENNRIVMRKLLHGLIGKNFSRVEIMLSTQGVVGGLDIKHAFRGNPQSVYGLCGYFGADSIPADHGEIQYCCHSLTLKPGQTPGGYPRSAAMRAKRL